MTGQTSEVLWGTKTPTQVKSLQMVALSQRSHIHNDPDVVFGIIKRYLNLLCGCKNEIKQQCVTVKVEILSQQKRLQTILFTIKDTDLGVVAFVPIALWLTVTVMEENQKRQRAGSQGETVKKKPSRAKLYGHSAECLTLFLYSHHPPTLSSHLSVSFQPTLHHPPVPWHFCTKATQRNRHACIENQINMSLLWPWGEVSNISFQGNNDSSFNSPYFTVCPNEYTAWVILIEHQPASWIMTLTVLSRYDDLMTMDLLIYPEICSTFFMKT